MTRYQIRGLVILAILTLVWGCVPMEAVPLHWLKWGLTGVIALIVVVLMITGKE